MITVLDRPLRRLIMIEGEPYVATIGPDGIRVVPKGKRKGATVTWQDIISGAVALDAQLVGSLSASRKSADVHPRTQSPRSGKPPPPKPKGS